MKHIKVMWVNDLAVVHMGFRLLLQATLDIEVVAEACSGEKVCQHVQAAETDRVVMDLAMPGMGGMEAIKRLRTKFEIWPCSPSGAMTARSINSQPASLRCLSRWHAGSRWHEFQPR